MSRVDYDSKIETFQAIPDAESKSLNMPVDAYLQEAENLYQWCQEDKDALTKAGLDWSYVDDLPVRAGALREAESIWFKERFSQQEAQKIWNEKSPQAYELRDELLHIMQFAYRNDPALARRVSEIYEGGSHADMIQDLNDISVLGKANTAPLEAISVDLTLLDQAADMANEMADLLSKATVGKEDKSPTRIIRDKAYTHLKEAVDEIRNCGQFVFWRNESRHKGYVSAYFRRNRKKTKTPAEENVI
ncbi:MAG: hypothetical protein P8Y99_05285 [Calditrichaceae bacterium]